MEKLYLDMITRDICKLYEEELNIPQESIYIKYEEVDNWILNGLTFK